MQSGGLKIQKSPILSRHLSLKANPVFIGKMSFLARIVASIREAVIRRPKVEQKLNNGA
jgi:hypothetical protein